MCQSSAERGNDVLILVHRKELAEQHRQLFAEHGIDTTHIRIALFFSEVNRLGKHKRPSLIICDECHWIPKTLRKVLDYYDCRVIGLSATPCRLSGESMGAVYDELITGISTKELIAQHRLAPYKYYSVPVTDPTNIATQRGEYVMASAEETLMKPAIYGDAIEAYKQYADGKRTIIYCASIKHSKAVVEAFCNAGYKAAHIDGSTPKDERKRVMDGFRSGEITIISNVMLIVEGISVPDCECCILLRPTLSTTIFIQSSMRCMRYKPGKTAIILDLVMNYSKLGLPDDDREWSLDKPVKPKNDLNPDGDFFVRMCPSCFKVFKTAPRCPHCGQEYPLHPREIEAKKNIELARITSEEAKKAEEQRKKMRKIQGKARTFEELVKLGKERNYKNPAAWAAMVLRGRKR